MSNDPPRLTPGEIAAFLQANSATLIAQLGALPAHLLAWHPAPGEWCIKEVVGHLIEVERRGFAGRIRIILHHQDSMLEAWDQVEVARARRDCERDARDLLAEFSRMRDASAALVATLREADLPRGGQHPKVGHLRVADLLQEWVHHDLNHLRQIQANVQAFVWPAMGNAQRFSAD